MRGFALLLLLAWGCAGTTEVTPPPTPAPSSRDERLKRGLDLYAKYPPPEWGSHVVERIAGNPVRRGGPVTPQQREFMENYELWELARRHVEARDRKP